MSGYSRLPLCLETFEDRLLLDGGLGTLGLEPSLTDLMSPINPAEFGRTIALTARVTPEDGDGPTPTGLVSFRESGLDLAVVELTAGVAVFETAGLAAGTHFLTAVYAGDDNYAGSESELLVQFVVPAATTTDVVSSAATVVVGQEVTFTATVTAQAPGGGVPVGTVSFFSDGVDLGEVLLNEEGQAELTTTFAEAGNFTITAVYAGSDDHESSTSPDLTQTVASSATTTTLDVELDEAVFGQPVLLVATVAAVPPGVGVPTGTVTFRAGNVVLGTATLTEDGTATFTAETIPVGTFALTASYDGDPNYLESLSSAVSIRISQADAALAVEIDPAEAALGQTITFTLTVTAQEPSGAVPTGQVVLLNGNQVLAIGQLQDGEVVFRISTLALGRYTLRARYDGSSGFRSSMSDDLAVFVGTLNQRWVGQVYRDLLQRQVDPDGLAVFSRMLDRGDDFAVVALRIMYECSGNRCEFWELTVRNLYQSLLRRQADPGGLAANVAFLRQGGTLAGVKAQLLGSAEYYFNVQFGAGGTDNGFVTAVFRDVFGRTPTAQERTFWVQVIQQGAGRDQVALSLLRDDEGLAFAAQAHVRRILGRDADANEIAELVFLLQNGSREEDVLALLVGSFEYVNLV